METKAEFSTRSDQCWYVGMNLLMFALIGIVGCAGMWIRTGMPGPGLMVLFVSLFSGAFMALILKKQPNARLHFVGDSLEIDHVDGNRYEVRSVPTSHFSFHQTVFEKKHNVGRLQVKGTAFYFYGIQNFDETCRCIRVNFPDS